MQRPIRSQSYMDDTKETNGLTEILARLAAAGAAAALPFSGHPTSTHHRMLRLSITLEFLHLLIFFI